MHADATPFMGLDALCKALPVLVGVTGIVWHFENPCFCVFELLSTGICLPVFAAAETVSTLLRSNSHNLRYVGIDALARIVRINPKFANEHQVAVIDCLEDPDETLKKKTLELLYKMTKPNNVEVSHFFVRILKNLFCSTQNLEV